MDPVTAGSAIGWAIGPGVLTSFPGAAEAFAQVLISGADVEVGWAGILAALTGSDSLSATILLSNIRSVREKERAVLAVAKSHLPPELFDVLKIGSLALRAHRERRNVFAHST